MFSGGSDRPLAVHAPLVCASKTMHERHVRTYLYLFVEGSSVLGHDVKLSPFLGAVLRCSELTNRFGFVLNAFPQGVQALVYGVLSCSHFILNLT